MGFLLVFSQTGEHHFKHPAEFPGLHHVDVELIENARVLCQALRKGGTTLHGIRERVDGPAENLIGFLFAQHGQATQQRQAGIDQRGQLTREDHEDLGFDSSTRLAPGLPLATGPGCRLFPGRAELPFSFLDHLGRIKPLGPQLSHRFGIGSGLHGSGCLFALGI